MESRSATLAWEGETPLRLRPWIIGQTARSNSSPLAYVPLPGGRPPVLGEDKLLGRGYGGELRPVRANLGELRSDCCIRIGRCHARTSNRSNARHAVAVTYRPGLPQYVTPRVLQTAAYRQR